MSFKFIHAADIHLDSPLRGLSRRGEIADVFVGASRRAFENLVSAAIEEQVAFLIIAGDIYDGDWRDYATGQFFVRQMGRLARAGIKVFTIRGNHDADSVITKNLPLPSNVHAFSIRTVERMPIEDLKVMLHGRGFANRHVPENVALTYPAATPGYFNIGILHTSLTGREGHDVYAPCSIEDLRRAGYDYWALGHIHRREILSRDPAIVFPGNLQGRHARETGAKGAMLVSVTDGAVAAIQELTLDAVRFAHVELDLSGVDDPADFLRKARDAMEAAHSEAEGRPLALRLTITGETALHSHLRAHSEQVVADMEAVAAEVSADLLIEKVRAATTSPRVASALTVAGLDEVLAAVAADPAFRDEIARLLADLRSKLPAGLMESSADGAQDTLAASAIAAAEDTVRAALQGASLPRERGA